MAVDARTLSQLEATPLQGDLDQLAEWVRVAADCSGVSVRFAGSLQPCLLRHAYAAHCLEGGWT